MKQVKHFSIWIIALFLGLMGSTVSAWAQQYDFTQGGLYYKIHGSDVHIVSEKATSPYNTQGGSDFTIQKTVTHGGNTYNVTQIGAHAFENRNIMSVNILADITEIGESAFIGNYLLWSCYLRGNGLTSIGEKAFYSCQSLRSLDIPESVTSIGKKAFGKCFALKPRVHWMNSGSIPPIQENVFEDIGISPEYSVLYVPEGTMLEYLNRNVWSKFFIVEDVLLSFLRQSGSQYRPLTFRKGYGYNAHWRCLYPDYCTEGHRGRRLLALGHTADHRHPRRCDGQDGHCHSLGLLDNGHHRIMDHRPAHLPDHGQRYVHLQRGRQSG